MFVAFGGHICAVKVIQPVRTMTIENSGWIDICTYAILSNHYHVVLHVDEQRAQSWSDLEVIEL